MYADTDIRSIKEKQWNEWRTQKQKRLFKSWLCGLVPLYPWTGIIEEKLK